MRDLNVGRDINVQGNMIIQDQSQEHKLLIHCTNEELNNEEIYRKQNLKQEKQAKFKKLMFSLCLVGVLFLMAAILYWFKGNMNMYSLLLGASSFFIGIQSINFFEKPTQFEQRQMEALNEINMILRERRQR